MVWLIIEIKVYSSSLFIIVNGWEIGYDLGSVFVQWKLELCFISWK